MTSRDTKILVIRTQIKGKISNTKGVEAARVHYLLPSIFLISKKTLLWKLVAI